MLLNTKVFATTAVLQSSMQDTLMEGQHLFIDKLTYNFAYPKKGDIIVFIENKSINSFADEIKVFLTDVKEVFKPINEKSNIRLVKRVVGTPGDLVDIKDGKIYINGVEQNEPYVKGVTSKRDFQLPDKVPYGKYFVLGDNRGVSKDSRSFGFIDRSQVEGRAVFRFWPMDTFGKLK
ncbi:MAG: signal peptidase I [Ruminiclostridium sp.]|nr:signal peptidase I [Ruminiclostridium sp.]